MKYLTLLLLLALSVSLTGCGNGDTGSELMRSANGTNIKKLANLYNKFQAEHNWTGPKDQADFKAYIEKLEPHILADFNLEPSNIDEAFKSSRDNEPFVIRWEVKGGMGSVEPVIFEKTGVDGKRQVAFTGMKLEEVDDSQYENYMAGKGGKSMTRSGEAPPNG